jgi:hypothetical protein
MATAAAMSSNSLLANLIGTPLTANVSTSAIPLMGAMPAAAAHALVSFVTFVKKENPKKLSSLELECSVERSSLDTSFAVSRSVYLLL